MSVLLAITWASSILTSFGRLASLASLEEDSDSLRLVQVRSNATSRCSLANLSILGEEGIFCGNWCLLQIA